jgi:hypothetical protein
MDKDNKKKVFETKDIAISSFLCACDGIIFSGKYRLQSGGLIFRFSPKEQAERLEQSYWQLCAPPIQPRKLFSAQRDLKDMIFGGRL